MTRTDENVDRVRKFFRSNCQLCIQLADTLHTSTFAVHEIVTKALKTHQVCAKPVPKVLTEDQKEPTFALSRIAGFDSK